jgi:transposase InsO family protein
MDATRPAGSNFLQQQAKFDAFVLEFNNERPHEALDMKYPADIYKPSTRPYRSNGVSWFSVKWRRGVLR